MIFHENRLLADDSHELSFPYLFQKLGKMLQNLSSAAVAIGALRVNYYLVSFMRTGLVSRIWNAASKNSTRLVVKLNNITQ